jgi:RimJ/RimL family protein N-acetyltransferase
MPAFPDLPLPLAGTRVALRLASERDIPEILIAHQDDSDLDRRIGLIRPPSGAELGRRTELAQEDRLAGVSVWLTLVEPGSDECRGQLDVGDVDWDHGRAGLRIWVAPADRGRGLAGEALALAGRWLVREAGLERVELLVEPDNAPMLAAGAAAGFSNEGVLRGYLLQRGRRIDVVAMSLIRADLEGA